MELAALPVDSGSVSNSYMIAHNYNASSRVSNTHSHLGTLHTHGPQRYMQARYTYTHEIKTNLKKKVAAQDQIALYCPLAVRSEISACFLRLLYSLNKILSTKTAAT